MTRPFLATAIVMLGAVAGHAAAAPAAPIEISSPAAGDSVAVKSWIRGTAESGIQRVWVIVHPPQSDACWAEGPAIVGRDGAWRLKAQFALPATIAPKDSYELRAFSDPRGSLSPGLVDCGVEAKRFSDAVYVTRK